MTPRLVIQATSWLQGDSTAPSGTRSRLICTLPAAMLRATMGLVLRAIAACTAGAQSARLCWAGERKTIFAPALVGLMSPGILA